jgi:O-succinylbenzoate synthase
MLQVDANAAYSLADARHLARLDAFDPVLIEQPLPEEDLLGHADLAHLMRTPICLVCAGPPGAGLVEPPL